MTKNQTKYIIGGFNVMSELKIWSKSQAHSWK